MDVHALAVHSGQAQVEVDELLVEGVDDPVGADGVPGPGALQTGAFLCAVLFEQLQPLGRIPVRVDIDGADAVRAMGLGGGVGIHAIAPGVVRLFGPLRRFFPARSRRRKCEMVTAVGGIYNCYLPVRRAKEEEA